MTATSREPAKPSSNGRLLQQWRRLGGWQIVLAVAAAWFVLEHLHPELLVRDTTPTGGDTGAHVWAPDALRRDLFGDGKLSGWSPDWFAGFPAFRFYMVVPAAAIALLGTVIPPNIAFKLVVAAGPVSLPVAAYAAGRLARLPAPTPGLFAVATVPFLFDRYHTIWGGNIAASLAGEFGYSLSLSLSLLALGLVAAGVRDGRGQARAAAVLALAVLCHPIPALFAAFGSVAIVALTGDPRRWLWLARVGAAALTITAFWTVPFLWDRALVVDLGWEPIGDEIDALFRLDAGRDHLRWVVAAAGVGTVTAWTGGRLFERALPVTAAGLAVTIVSLPAGQLWNARLLPLWYLCLHLLAASGVGAILRAVVTGRHQLLARRWTPTTQIAVIVSVGLGAASAAVVAGSVGVVIGIAAALLIGSEAAVLGGPRQGSQLAMIGASGLIVAAVLISVAMPLRSLPFGSLDDDGTYHWGPFSTTDHSFVATWAAWNNEGYEAKIGDETGGGWDEYRGIIETMTAVGAERGCGRAMWEADNDLDRYGSPMALALLPYWTNGCIASMEGLYFESSATTPFHFVNQVELSESPAPALRGIEYGGFDISSGLDHLRLFGVDYYLAQSPTAVTAARAEPGLVEVETAEPWVVFEVDGSTLVEGVGYQPVVVEGVGDGEEWRDLALLPYLGVTDHRALIAADGPDEWTRVGKDAVEVGVGAIATESVVVSDIDMGTDSLSFDVDRLGVPVLVKVSWFPSWQARGADGPYRVAPNLMVVIPTSERVELRFVDRPIDIAARITTAVGLAALVLLRRRPIELTPLDRPTCLES